MKHEIKIFAIVGLIATICVTSVSLYAISKNAEWANIGIIVGIVCATLTAIIPVTQHILFRFKSGSDGSKEFGVDIAQKNAAQDVDNKEEGAGKTIISEKEAEKLLVQLVLEQQNIFVRKSYGESAAECFTWDDLDRFKQENTIARIQRNLKENNKFSDLVKMLTGLPERKQKDIFQKGRYTFKKTWAELGEITIAGQTVAGQRAEKMIADTIVELAKEQVVLKS